MGCTSSSDEKKPPGNAGNNSPARAAPASADSAAPAAGAPPREDSDHGDAAPVAARPAPTQSGGPGKGYRKVVPAEMRKIEDADALTGRDIEFVVIQKPKQGIQDCTLYDCFIDNASGDNGIRKCKLINCVLNNCKLDECVMERCGEVASSELSHTKVKDCTLKDKSKLWECDINLTNICAGCNVYDSTIGPVITTTESHFVRCRGTPNPPPPPDLCTECIWS
eukprot:TRINITY_DN6970_c2_g1_i1.p1 TRINITY_DN6970_c2_g1~~TRINITY_DN6970_c2_g1_i1.p1  ORF type:complete len:258 (+),score=83.52 TRINITY_DN6970_c2_g1_i1:106-774(+)